MNNMIKVINFCRKNKIGFNYDPLTDVLQFSLPREEEVDFYVEGNKYMAGKYPEKPYLIFMTREYFDQFSKIKSIKKSLKEHL